MKWKLFIVIAVLSSSLFANVRLQSIFGNNMVLQRNSFVNFWGTAEAEEKVNIHASWGASEETITGKNGKWKLKLKTPDAGGPFSVTITGKNKIVFDNVMSGEVWLCTGQSNMDCNMTFFKDTKEAVANANYSKIRLFIVAKKISNTPLETLRGGWVATTPKTVASFSATGYFFGLKLYQKLNIPIGLIECAWGGTRIETWTPWEKQNDNPRLIREKKNTQLQAKKYDEAKERKIFNEKLEKFKIDTKAWKSEGKKGAQPRHPRFKQNPLKSPNYLSNLYNGMLNPLAPYTVKGAIWYQGESNAWRANEYAKQLEIMIKAWREKWGQGDFPFYFVQLPGFNTAWTSPVEENAPWAFLREAFANVAKKVKNTAMAITIDIGEAKNIHPLQKDKVGERLARLAFYRDYGKKDVVWTGPIMKSCKFQNGKAIITFETGGSPLTVRNNEKLKGFAFCDNNGVFVYANAKIVSEDIVEVSSPKVKNPTMLYYAWARNPEGVNLINKEGLPASPFRYGKKYSFNMLKHFIPKIEKDYTLVYEINPKSAICKKGGKFIYKQDNSSKIKDSFSKIAYFLGLRDRAGKMTYAFVEMDAFTQDIKKIGVPDKASKARFQIPVTNVMIKSNVVGVKTGVFPEGCSIEFCASNYSPVNIKKIQNASSKLFDFGDSIGNTNSIGYGSMQIHNVKEKQSIICFNNFRANRNADIGIGNASTKNSDWTFAKNASKYSLAELKVLIKK